MKKTQSQDKQVKSQNLNDYINLKMFIDSLIKYERDNAQEVIKKYDIHLDKALSIGEYSSNAYNKVKSIIKLLDPDTIPLYLIEENGIIKQSSFYFTDISELIFLSSKNEQIRSTLCNKNKSDVFNGLLSIIADEQTKLEQNIIHYVYNNIAEKENKKNKLDLALYLQNNELYFFKNTEQLKTLINNYQFIELKIELDEKKREFELLQDDYFNKEIELHNITEGKNINPTERETLTQIIKAFYCLCEEQEKIENSRYLKKRFNISSVSNELKEILDNKIFINGGGVSSDTIRKKLTSILKNK